MTGVKELKIQEADKLNILCLHGYRQDGDSFRSKTGSFRKFLKKYANFTFVSAEFLAKPLTENDATDEHQKSWWFNKDDGSFKGTNQNGPAIGFQQSLKLVEKIWSEGNHHGLIGFSQGGSFVSLICSLSQRKMTTINPRFALISSGFPSQSLAHKNLYEQKISIPSLHVYGLSDEIIPGELSQKLSESFENPIVVTHSGGHYFPATINEKQSYINFFQDQLQAYLEDKELKMNGVMSQDNDEDES